MRMLWKSMLVFSKLASGPVDVAKSVFQVHGVDADGTVVIHKSASRAKVIEFFRVLPVSRRADKKC
jgi:hypothetical protein